MNFQELTQIWQQTDQAIESKSSLNRRLFKEASTSKIRSHLYEIKWTSYIQIIIGFFFFIFLLEFAMSHLAMLKFAIPAFVLIAITLFGVVLDSYQLFVYYSIQADDSIVQTQSRLEKLRQIETIDNLSLLVLIPLFVAPFAIVMAKAFLAVDLYSIFGMLINFTIGSAVVAIILTVLLIIYPNKKLKESIEFTRELKD